MCECVCVYVCVCVCVCVCVWLGVRVCVGCLYIVWVRGIDPSIAVFVRVLFLCDQEGAPIGLRDCVKDPFLVA